MLSYIKGLYYLNDFAVKFSVLIFSSFLLREKTVIRRKELLANSTTEETFRQDFTEIRKHFPGEMFLV